MLMADAVCVVVTCHNLEKYIGEAIESVLNQDYRGPVDVVVVDDCSTDRSAEIIRSYSSVRYVRTERNLGVLMATVIGLENTRGELIFFLDGDDVWETCKLSVVVERFRTNSRLALVTHDLHYIDSKGMLLGRESRPETVMARVPLSCDHEMIHDGIVFHLDYVWLGSAFAVRRTLGKVAAFCEFARGLVEPFDTYQDWPLAFWVACQSEARLGYVSRKLFRYRLHGANHSGDASSVSKAARNFRRSGNTMLAISVIACRFHAAERVQKVTQKKLEFYRYLEALYSRQTWRATAGFICNLPYVTTTKSALLKETVRFLGVQFLGPERFIRLAKAIKT